VYPTQLSLAFQGQHPTTIAMQALYGRQSTAACLQQQRPLRLKPGILQLSKHVQTCNALLVSSQSSSKFQLSGSSSTSSTCRSRISQTATRSQAQEQVDLQTSESQLVGEDAASFDFSKQSLQSWGIFVALLSTVLGALYLVSKLALLEELILHKAACMSGSFRTPNRMRHRTSLRLLAVAVAFHTHRAALPG
jgi:hypothetical protein